MVTEEDAKAARAWSKAITEPIAQSATKVQVPTWCDQLDTITSTLAEYEFDADEIRTLRRRETKLDNELEVQEFRLGLRDAEVAS